MAPGGWFGGLMVGAGLEADETYVDQAAGEAHWQIQDQREEPGDGTSLHSVLYFPH